MTEIDKDAWLRDLHNSECLLVTFLRDGDAGLDLLMEIASQDDPAESVSQLMGVVASLLGFVRGTAIHRIQDGDVTMEQIITDITIGYLEQRQELDSPDLSGESATPTDSHGGNNATHPE